MKQKQFRNENPHGTKDVLVDLKKGACLIESGKRIKQSYLAKALLVLLLILGNSSFLFAQMQWGVKIGTNASTQSELGDICDDNNLKVGFNFGVIGQYQINDWMAIRSGIDYQQKGFKCNVDDSENELKNNLQYLILPLKVAFSASEKAGFKNGQRLFFASGPYLGYLLKAEHSESGITKDLDDLNEIDFGWSFELGMQFHVLKSNALQLSINYDMGFSEIETDSDIQNKSASFNLGFLF